MFHSNDDLTKNSSMNKFSTFSENKIFQIFSVFIFLFALTLAFWPTISRSQMVPMGFWKPVASSSADYWVLGGYSLDARKDHVAVWTGSKMIIWGGQDGNLSLVYNTGAAYDPATNTWTILTTTGAPSGRCAPGAVWSGTEMIIWGGNTTCSGTPSNTGARYNPATDTWTGITSTGAPTARQDAPAVWTGTKMIVWGGGGGSTTGGLYDPATDTWTATSTTGAPSARWYHTAVWTGSEMLIWGGNVSGTSTNTGRKYDPSTDTWSVMTTTSAPSAREGHTAVWTGSRMIVWGGENSGGRMNSGGSYNPVGNSWTSSTTTLAAPSARYLHSAVWTGTKMIVWGGKDGITTHNTGGVYDPSGDSWTDTSAALAPQERTAFTAVWSGTEMIIWGGVYSTSELNSGGRYNPTTDVWNPTGTAQTGGVTFNSEIITAWTGSKFIAWGGCYLDSYFMIFICNNSGATYDSSTDTWSQMTTSGAPAPFAFMSGAWGGSRFVVWGGADPLTFLPSNTGSRYDPATDTWLAMTTTGAPSARYGHSATGIGTKIIFWGGHDGTVYVNSGGQYDPTADSWSTITTASAPVGRANHNTVWTGTRLLIWSGDDSSSCLNSGGRYDPVGNAWQSITTTGAPAARCGGTTVWTGSKMILWGGSSSYGGTNWVQSGGQYDPTANNWSATTTTGAPSARGEHTAVWSGTKMIVWGGESAGLFQDTGASYDPTANSWVATTLTNVAKARMSHFSVWMGTKMFVWGGNGVTGDLQDRAFYFPQ